ANSLSVDNAKNFTSGDGSSLTQTGTPAGSINVNLLGGIASSLDNLIQQVRSLEQSAEGAITALKNALPLLPLDTTSSVATLLGVATKIASWASSIDSHLSALSGPQTLSAVRSAIDSATNTLGFTSTEDYRGALSDGHLEVLLKLSFDKTGSLTK